MGNAFITLTNINSGLYDIFISLSKNKYKIIHMKMNTDEINNIGFFIYFFASSFNIISPNLHNTGYA